MRWLLLLSFFVFSGVEQGYAQQVSLSQNRPELDLLILQKQFNAKRIYRDAYEHDNGVKFSTLDQLEYAIANNPGFDEDTMAVVEQGAAFFEKMDFGLYQDNMKYAGIAFQYEPSASLKMLSGLSRTNATPKDALSVVNIMESAEHMKEKMLKGEPLGSKGYQININDF